MAPDRPVGGAYGKPGMSESPVGWSGFSQVGVPSCEEGDLLGILGHRAQLSVSLSFEGPPPCTCPGQTVFEAFWSSA
jgi:hypothetical protein